MPATNTGSTYQCGGRRPARRVRVRLKRAFPHLCSRLSAAPGLAASPEGGHRRPMAPPLMQFQRDGAAHYPQAVNNILPSLLRALEFSPEGKGRSRMIALRSLTECLRHSSLPRIANELLGPKARPVRAVVFDKTAEENWALTWHQDRTIAVQQRSETPGFRNWTVKQGIVHCEPPFALLAGMITVRLHLDPAGLDNAPLKIAPGSHCRGVIAEADIGGAVRACGTVTCTATRAISGFTRRRSSTHRTQHCNPAIAESCRSTTVRIACPVRWPGCQSEPSRPARRASHPPASPRPPVSLPRAAVRRPARPVAPTRDRSSP